MNKKDLHEKLATQAADEVKHIIDDKSLVVTSSITELLIIAWQKGCLAGMDLARDLYNE